MKTLIDIESIFILLLCILNTTSQIKEKKKIIHSTDTFNKPYAQNITSGLNATSISEITKVPRTTVLRKISNLEKIGIIKKDKFKRYASNDLSKAIDSKKILSIMDHYIKLLGIFFSQCLETYSTKH